MKKTPVHVVWRSLVWVIRYENGELSKIRSRMQAGIIGIALSLGRVVVVHDKNGRVDYILQPEERSRFHLTMLALAVSFLAMIAFAVWLVIWLARTFF